MSQSPVEKLNEIKEEELRLRDEKIARGETVENTDNSLVNGKKGSYSVTPGDRSRTHKGAIGIDRDPSII
jgi:hypothetical protein